MESTYFLNILKKNVKFNTDIKLVSTKGHLFDYSTQNKKIIFFLKKDKKNIIEFFTSIDKKENIVIIATDQDPAGELIAVEVASFFKKAKILRFAKPVEFLLTEKVIDKDFLFKYSYSKINILKAVRYLEEKFLSDYNNEKLKVLNILSKNEISKIKKIKI
jgi:hypothetical protein